MYSLLAGRSDSTDAAAESAGVAERIFGGRRGPARDWPAAAAALATAPRHRAAFRTCACAAIAVGAASSVRRCGSRHPAARAPGLVGDRLGQIDDMTAQRRAADAGEGLGQRHAAADRQHLL